MCKCKILTSNNIPPGHLKARAQQTHRPVRTVVVLQEMVAGVVVLLLLLDHSPYRDRGRRLVCLGRCHGHNRTLDGYSKIVVRVLEFEGGFLFKSSVWCVVDSSERTVHSMTRSRVSVFQQPRIATSYSTSSLLSAATPHALMILSFEYRQQRCKHLQ